MPLKEQVDDTQWGNKQKHKHKMGPQNTGVMLRSTTKDGVFRIKGRPFQEEFKTICFDKRDIFENPFE